MSNLFAFGDSLTFGYALPDVYDTEESKTIVEMPTYEPYTSSASKLAWPHHLSTMTNMPYYNYGVPGASNKEILWRFNHVLSAIKPSDTVCFLWTNIIRYVILSEEYETILDARAGRTSNGPNYRMAQVYSRVANPHDLLLTTINSIHFTHYACSHRGAQSYHILQGLDPSDHGYEDGAYMKNVPNWPDDINLAERPLLMEEYADTALDDNHPGPIEQRNIAKKFLKLITQKDKK